MDKKFVFTLLALFVLIGFANAQCDPENDMCNSTCANPSTLTGTVNWALDNYQCVGYDTDPDPTVILIFDGVESDCDGRFASGSPSRCYELYNYTNTFDVVCPAYDRYTAPVVSTDCICLDYAGNATDYQCAGTEEILYQMDFTDDFFDTPTTTTIATTTTTLFGDTTTTTTLPYTCDVDREPSGLCDNTCYAMFNVPVGGRWIWATDHTPYTHPVSCMRETVFRLHVYTTGACSVLNPAWTEECVVVDEVGDAGWCTIICPSYEANGGNVLESDCLCENSTTGGQGTCPRNGCDTSIYKLDYFYFNRGEISTQCDPNDMECMTAPLIGLLDVTPSLIQRFGRIIIALAILAVLVIAISAIGVIMVVGVKVMRGYLEKTGGNL